MVFANVKREMLDSFRVTQLTDMFRFYDSLDAVTRFGRTARFDFLSLIDRLELADIAPGHAYLAGATGPLRGARLLYGDDDRPTRELEALVVELETYLGVGFDPLEDALCNWQKSPLSFKPFRG